MRATAFSTSQVLEDKIAGHEPPEADHAIDVLGLHEGRLISRHWLTGRYVGDIQIFKNGFEGENAYMKGLDGDRAAQSGGGAVLHVAFEIK